MSFLKHAGTGFAVTALSLRAQQGFAQAGGGTLFLSAGNYLCYSIRLKSNIAFYLDQGATIVAGDSPAAGGSTPASSEAYDAAEPNEWNQYQDFGHSHWHNSLIWAEGAENLAITGPAWGPVRAPNSQASATSPSR